MFTRRALLPLLLSSVALVGAGCGREGGAGARPGGRSEATVVAKRAYAALARGDLAGLEAEMDAQGRQALAADLRALRPGLAEPADAVPGVADEVRGVFAADGESLRRRASEASDAELLRFLARVRPPGGGPWPDTEAPRRADRAAFTYADAHAVRRPLVLRRTADGWRVTAVGL
ncbi:MAG: hypothetical protein R3F05_12800 [Planctomycetota bacterium]